MEWALLIVNALLLVATSVYAVVTFKIANANKESAQAAERSAAAAEKAIVSATRSAVAAEKTAESSERAIESAERAAAEAARAASAAYAGLPIGLEVRPRFRSLTDDQEHLKLREHQILNLGVEVESTSSNLMIHEVVLVHYARLIQEDMGGTRSKGEGPENEKLVPSQALPRRVYIGESLKAWTPTTWIPLNYVTQLAVDIHYSLDGSNVEVRRVDWSGDPATDFRFHGETTRREERQARVRGSTKYSVHVPEGEGLFSSRTAD